MRTFPRISRIRLAVVPLVAILVVTATLSAAAAAQAPGTPAPVPGQNRAGLVVRYGDGSYVTRCVAFNESEIGGDELLARSGLNLVIDPAGAVCAIGGQGCPADNCLCGCPFPECEYWGYYHLNNGAWLYSDVGAMFYTVMDGDVDGWSWGPGDFTQGVPPPLLTFEQICPAVEPTVTPTPTATFTPVPTYTPAPLPPAEIPEPSSLLLAASGLAGLGAWAYGLRRRKG